MTAQFQRWVRPFQLLRQRRSADTLQTVHSAPSSALPEDCTSMTMTPIIFTPVSPAPSRAKLSLELVPATCWCSNVRDHVSPVQWNRLRRQTYYAARSHCEICNGQGPQWPVECHEVWHYDDATQVQTLVRFIALCPACHLTKHIGLAEIKGHAAEARAHLARVNAWSEAETEAYLRQVWAVWEERSAHDWRLNLLWLEQWRIFVQPKR